MTLNDISNGPDVMIWVVVAILAIFSIILLTGYGANLIAGYNTASKEEKEKYDGKKMSRIVGVGMSVITLMVLAMGLWEDVLPDYAAYISLGIVVVDCAVMIVLANTICKK